MVDLVANTPKTRLNSTFASTLTHMRSSKDVAHDKRAVDRVILGLWRQLGSAQSIAHQAVHHEP